jgi:hypothetical protein
MRRKNRDPDCIGAQPADTDRITRIEAKQMLVEEIGRLEKRLLTSSFRTKRVKYIGGQRNGNYEWVEDVPTKIELPYEWTGPWYVYDRQMVEVYKRVGRSPADPNVYLFEHVETYTPEVAS